MRPRSTQQLKCDLYEWSNKSRNCDVTQSPVSGPLNRYRAAFTAYAKIEWSYTSTTPRFHDEHRNFTFSITITGNNAPYRVSTCHTAVTEWILNCVLGAHLHCNLSIEFNDGSSQPMHCSTQSHSKFYIFSKTVSRGNELAGVLKYRQRPSNLILCSSLRSIQPRPTCNSISDASINIHYILARSLFQFATALHQGAPVSLRTLSANFDCWCRLVG